jgi:peptidyl-prolyl cis-trans isomerase B (cyclophilin B)
VTESPSSETKTETETETVRPPADRRSSSTPAIVGAVVAVLVLVLGVWGLSSLNGSSKKDDAVAPANPGPTVAAAPTGAGLGGPVATLDTSDPKTPAAPCVWTDAPGEQHKNVGKPPKGEPRKGTATMTVETTLGTVEIAMNLARTPCTAWSFHYLGDKKFYDDTTCHRLTSPGPEASIGILQCGDPSSTGGGGPTYAFGDENLEAQADQVYERGVVAMANSGANTNGSQFFINFKDGQLQNGYTPFGVVTKGMDVIDAIASRGTDNSYAEGDGRPVQGFSIIKLRVTLP